MKSLLLVLLASFGCVATAQQSSPTPTPTPQPKIGFRQQGFDPSPLDPLSKLVLASPDSDERPASGLYTRYDQFEDRTMRRFVSFEALQIRNRGYGIERLWAMAFYSYRGMKFPAPIDSLGLIFDSLSATWVYLKDARLYAIADKERLVIGVPVSRESEIVSGGVTERLVFSVPYATMKKIASAVDLKMRLGPSEFALSDSFRSNFKTLLSEIKIPPKRGSKVIGKKPARR